MKKSKDKFEIEGFDIESGNCVGTRDQGGVRTEGELRSFVEGRPLQEDEEVVRVEAVENNVVYVESLYKHKGPSRTSNPRYRENYDTIFGVKPSAEIN